MRSGFKYPVVVNIILYKGRERQIWNGFGNIKYLVYLYFYHCLFQVKQYGLYLYLPAELMISMEHIYLNMIIMETLVSNMNFMILVISITTMHLYLIMWKKGTVYFYLYKRYFRWRILLLWEKNIFRKNWFKN